MSKRKCPKCGSEVKPHKVGGFACDLTLAHRNTKAPPVSSVPGEAGPYPSASKTCEHIQHGINAGVCLQCQLIPDYRELVNHGYFMCRASMKAELEAERQKNKSLVIEIGVAREELEAAKKAGWKFGEVCRTCGEDDQMNATPKPSKETKP